MTCHFYYFIVIGGKSQSETVSTSKLIRSESAFKNSGKSALRMLYSWLICPLLLFFLWDIWHRRRLDQAENARTKELEAELNALRAGKETEKEKPDIET